MTSKDILDYLATPAAERDFKKGLELYEGTRYNRNLMRLFQQKGANSYNTAKLEQELKQAAERMKAQGDQPNAPAQTKPKAQTGKPAKAEKIYPAELQPLIDERNKLLQEGAHLHSRLDVVVNPETLRLSCETIVYNSLRINQIWSIIDHFEATGELLTPEPVKAPKPQKGKDYATMTEAQLVQEKSNIRSSISKNKNKKEKLAEFEAKLKIVEQLLKKFDPKE